MSYTYITIQHRHSQPITINMMGHFKLFLQKYNNNIASLYFTMHPDQCSIIDSNWCIDIINELEIIHQFESKYKEFILIVYQL